MRSSFLLIGLALFAVPALAQINQPQWTADPRTGCRVWNSFPEPGASISWTGDCRSGLAQGRGVLQWFMNGRPESRFQGEYRDGLVNGRGVYEFSNGARYDGEYIDDVRSGQGILTHPDGGSYSGQWRNGLPNGTGTFKQPDGTTLSGNWTNGCLRLGDRTAVFLASRKSCGFE